MITDSGPDGPARHRRQPRLDRREPRPVRPDGRDLRRARPRRGATRGWRCCRSARRRARATPGSSAATELLDATDLHFVGNVEGKDLHHATWPTSSSATRSLGNVVIKFFEGLSTLHLRPVAGASSGGRSRGRLAYLLMRPGVARIRDVFDYETRRRLAAARACKGTVIITHGRAKRRMIGFACEVAATTARHAGPGADRRGAGRERRAARRRARPSRRPTSTAEAVVVSGPELTVGTARHRRARPARRVRGARASPGSAAAGRRGGGWPRPARRSASGSATTASSSGSGSSPARARRSARSTAQVRSAVAATVERLLGLDLGAVTVLVDGVGG